MTKAKCVATIQRAALWITLAAVGCALWLGFAGCGGHARRSVHPPGWGRTPTGAFLLPAPLGGVASREMFDTVTIATVPANPFAVAGYTSGFWPTWFGLLSAFPAAHHVSIAVTAAHHADCLDVEPGDASPAQVGPWVRADVAAGFPKPCLYGDLSNMPAIKANLAAWLGPNWRIHVFLWLAWYRYRGGLVAGFDAVQWTDHAYWHNLDESTVSLAFLSIAQPPLTEPTPPKPGPSPLAARQRTLRRVLVVYGCRRRKAAHEPLGPRCRRWFAEGDRIARELG